MCLVLAVEKSYFKVIVTQSMQLMVQEKKDYKEAQVVS